MKKILFFCAIFFTALTSNAQSVQVLRNGKTIAEFYERDGWTFVYGNNTNVLNGHEFVTIGGKKWATMNVGATTVAGSYATCTGDFYQWGSLHTLYSSKTWNGSTWNFTWKSGIEGGYVDANKEYNDNASILPVANDVAKYEWGSQWRMPTQDDFVALYNACSIGELKSGGTSSTTEKGIYWCNDYDGVKGVLFSDGTNKVFFPAVGYMNNGPQFGGGGSDGIYWSSTLKADNTDAAYYLTLKSSSVLTSHVNNRYKGFSVRPVFD